MCQECSNWQWTNVIPVGKSSEAKSSSLTSILRSKFLKLEVYKRSASVVHIFKWSWNESTTFTCQEFSMEESDFLGRAWGQS